MKVAIQENGVEEFKPIRLVIDIETKQEALSFIHQFNANLDYSRSYPVSIQEFNSEEFIKTFRDNYDYDLIIECYALLKEELLQRRIKI